MIYMTAQKDKRQEESQFTLLPRMPFGSEQHGTGPVISGPRYFISSEQ